MITSTNTYTSTNINTDFFFLFPPPIYLDLWTGNFTRYVLATNFKVTEFGPNQASPGLSYAFTPNIKMARQERPCILLGGDGSQEAYLLTPASSVGFAFNTTVLPGVSKGTIGDVAVGDINGDGWVDMLVPDYNHGNLFGFTFSPVAKT